MLSKLTLQNHAEPTPEDIVLHEDTNASRRLVAEATGLFGISPLRQSRRVRPQAHGSIDETKYGEGSLITLDGTVWSTVSIEAALEEFRKVSQVAQETLDYGPALLKWTEGVSGLKLQKLVRFADGFDPPFKEALAFIDYHAQFFAEDPRAYSQTLTTQVGASLSGSAPELTWEKVSTNPTSVGLAVDSAHIYYCNGARNRAIGRMLLAGGAGSSNRNGSNFPTKTGKL